MHRAHEIVLVGLKIGGKAGEHDRCGKAIGNPLFSTWYVGY